MQTKSLFVWDEPQPSPLVGDRLRFRSIYENDMPTLADAIERVLTNTADRALRYAVDTTSPRIAAASFLFPDPVFAYEPEWWRLAYSPDGNVVGFSQPVAFRGEERDGRDEVTLLLVGVLPPYRGRGYSVDLLADATACIQRRGAWRIYCDADVENVPMCAAFRKVGYRDEGTREVPLVR